MFDQSPDAPPPKLAKPDIVVVAPANTGKALADCLARKCPVVEDVNATMRHAEALFAAGKYPDARSTLLRSLSRNRAMVDKFPRAVAALYEAGATVAEHNGDRQEYRSFAFKSAYITARATTLSPIERLMGYVRAGDISAMQGDGQDNADVTFGGPIAADRYYRAAEEMAHSNGLGVIAQALELRRLSISARRGQSGKQRARLAAIIAAPDTDPKLALHARTILARLERQAGDAGATDRLVQTVQAQPAGTAPVLIWSPPLPTTLESQIAKDASRFGTSAPSPGVEGVRPYHWADIGYWVRPNGTVADAEVLRGSPGFGWTKPIVAMVSGRRYLASKASAEDPGQYRIERVTLTYAWEVPAGSLIRRRVGAPSFRFADLTREPFPAPSGG